MATLAEMNALVKGKHTLNIEGLVIPVKITDVREQFGRTDVLCVPVSGSGEKWVSLERVTTLKK